MKKLPLFIGAAILLSQTLFASEASPLTDIQLRQAVDKLIKHVQGHDDAILGLSQAQEKAENETRAIDVKITAAMEEIKNMNSVLSSSKSMSLSKEQRDSIILEASAKMSDLESRMKVLIAEKYSEKTASTKGGVTTTVFSPVDGVVNAYKSLHLRMSPSEDHGRKLAYLMHGEDVKIVGGSSNGWLNVVTEHGSGWAHGKYISMPKQ